MNKAKHLLFVLAAIFAVSCVSDPAEQTAPTLDALVAKKIVNTSVDAHAGELILCVDTETADLLLRGEAVTRSGATELDMALAEIGASNIEPVFNMQADPERARAYGLHQWFVVKYDGDLKLETAAATVAKVASVEGVQYNTAITKPHVEAVEVDPAAVAVTRAEKSDFNDPLLDMQWHYNNTGNTSIYPTALAGADINLFPAWKLTTGRPEIIVAVVDEGVDYDHVDIEANMWVNEKELNGEDGVDDDGNGFKDDIYGHNFVTNGSVTSSRPNDDGHGTHVAGTVAAVNNNGIGVAGVAGGSGNGDGVRIMSCQIFSNSQEGGVSATARAIQYAADNGASVLQCSWGFPAQSTGLANDNNFESGNTIVEYKAIQYFIEKKNCDALEGGIVIFAAGNDGKNQAGYPAAYNDYIAVTGIAPDGKPGYYTNYDRGCNIAAPGGEQLYTTNTGMVYSLGRDDKYAYMQGTSMACPHVSGIAALGLSYALDLGKTFTVDEFKTILLTSVNEIDSRLTGLRDSPTGDTMNLNNYRGKMGTGVIDAYRVLMSIRGTTCVAVPLNEEFVLNANKYLGDGNVDLRVVKNGLIISDEVREELGIEGDVVYNDKDRTFSITCTKPGSGIVTVQLIAGGISQGGGLNIGGMLIEKELALIVRPGTTEAGGWL